MWAIRSHTLHPLIALKSPKVKFKWTDVEQKAFDYIKRTVSHDTLLEYPDFNKRFDIHSYARDYQLWAVISKNGKPITFYSRKWPKMQPRYTVMEKELLSIVKNLKEFRTILLGQQLKIFTDHKNITCKNFNTDRVLRWRLIIEEYILEIEYIPGDKNIVADALSQLPNNGNKKTTHESTYTTETMPELYDIDEIPEGTFPILFNIIDRYQR